MGKENSQDINKVIGSKIRQHRERIGWTIEDLAKDMGLSISQVQRIETGAFDIKLVQVLKAAMALGLKLRIEVSR